MPSQPPPAKMVQAAAQADANSGNAARNDAKKPGHGNAFKNHPYINISLLCSGAVKRPLKTRKNIPHLE